MMKKYKDKGILITAIFLMGMVISSYLLLQLRSDLSVTSGVISSSEWSAAAPYIIRVQIAVFITFLLGLSGFYIIQKTNRQELIYVEKARENNKNKESSASDATSSADTKIISDISQIMNSGGKKKLEKAFHTLCNSQEAVTGALYTLDDKESKLELEVPFALSFSESERPAYELGDGFVGQSAKDRKPLFIENLPETTQQAVSGLGSSKISFLAVIPMIHQEKLVGICELGSFKKISEADRQTLANACDALAAHMPGVNGKNKDKTSKS
jgi:putative methionine-R-sulfoxide reductase with GAF domain